ncbi:MAG: hypothetical protein Q8O84_05205 [Nanoarchaeota archaeon]|nr:hypothetical protein [Nanoarchaeota archaeon]
MMKILRNRKGEKVISVYWFAILFIVAAAIVYMVAVFYGKPYDVRKMEADLLTDKISECLAQGGYLKQTVFEESFKDNFLSECSLTFNVEDVYGWGEQEQFYSQIEIYGFSNDVLVSEFSVGNKNLKDFCDKNGEGFPKCVEREFYSLDKNDNQYKIKILSIVRKIEKNVQ